MKLLFICITSPFVINDGVSAALHSLFKNISSVFEDLDIYIIDSKMFFRNKNYDKEYIVEYNSISLDDYDIVFTSPITSMLKIKNNLPKKSNTLFVCQISDCIVYELWRSFILSFKFKKINLLPLFKIPYYYYKEYQINKLSDIVLLQTERDVRIFNKLFFTRKGESLPNINLPINDRTKSKFDKKKSIGWCATFQGEYLKLAKWFFNSTLYYFLKENKNVNLELAGKNNILFSLYIKENFPELEKQIKSNGYIEDIISFNYSNRVIISPVFKGYGLINKTIEAMMSGVVVLGDNYSFNGISGCINQINCMIAETPNEFISSLNYLFNKCTLLELDMVGKKGRELIYKQFSLEKNNEKLKKVIESLQE